MGMSEQQIENKCILPELGDNENKNGRGNKLIQKLMEVYEVSKSNNGDPKCIFPETDIFNEGWLLRGILNSLMNVKDIKNEHLLFFLPFPDESKRFSEGRLKTPFEKKVQEDSNSTEGSTPIDGIVGDFELIENSKSGIRILPDFNYISFFEAKMCSSIGTGTRNEKNFSQISRDISYIIFQIMKIKNLEGKTINLVVFYPMNNKKINPKKYTDDNKKFIKNEIKNKISGYKLEHKEPSQDFKDFESNYEKLLDRVNLNFIDWETILKEIKDDTPIHEFYNLCKEFNKPKKVGYPLKKYPHTVKELLKQLQLDPKKMDEWIKKDFISKSEIPKKCIINGHPGGRPVITSDGYFVNLSPTINSFWNGLSSDN